MAVLPSSDSGKLFYQAVGMIESRLTNNNQGPFDPELEGLFNKVQEYYSQAIKFHPNDKQLTMKHLKIQLLRALVDQNNFQQALIASIAADDAASRPTPVEIPRTGAGRVAINDGFRGAPVAALKDRVTNETLNIDFN